MTRKKTKGLSEKHIVVAIGLLGLDEMGYPRTQSMVSEITGIQRNSMSRYVKDLTDGKYLIETKNNGREKFYGKGSSFALLETQITDEITHKMVFARHCRKNQGGYLNNDISATKNVAEMDIIEGKGNPKDMECPIALDIHQTGSWIQFRVETAGELHNTTIIVKDPQTGKPKEVKQTIFPENSEWEFDGGVNWVASFILPGADLNRFKIRYQQTERKGYFYVLPEFDVLVTPEQALNEDVVRSRFLVACTPLLRWFEKYAGWVFMKDEFQKYVITSKVKVDEVHKALRGPVNDALVDVTGGIFGRSDEGIWCDCSPGSPEVETTQAAYVESVIKLPETTAKADLAYRNSSIAIQHIQELIVRTDLLSKQAESTNNLMTKVVQINDKLADVVTKLTQNQTNLINADLDKEQSELSENQTKLADYYKPKNTSEDDSKTSPPPEGYR